MKRRSLGDFEQLVLLAILRLKDQAYGTRIAQELETQAGRRVSRGALYSSLDRLEKKGFLRWEVAATTSERRGQPRRCFEITPVGIEALKEPHRAWMNLTAGLEDILGGPSS